LYQLECGGEVPTLKQLTRMSDFTGQKRVRAKQSSAVPREKCMKNGVKSTKCLKENGKHVVPLTTFVIDSNVDTLSLIPEVELLLA
jgi:hypothetical protein